MLAVFLGGSGMVSDSVVRKSICRKYRYSGFGVLWCASNVKHNKTQYFIVYLNRQKPCKRWFALLPCHFPVFAIATFPLHIVFCDHIAHCDRPFTCIILYHTTYYIYVLSFPYLFSERSALFVVFSFVFFVYSFLYFYSKLELLDYLHYYYMIL